MVHGAWFMVTELAEWPSQGCSQAWGEVLVVESARDGHFATR